MAPLEQPAAKDAQQIPEVEKQVPDVKKEDEKADETAEPLPAPPIEKEDPAAYASCKSALASLGVTYKE
ncbi:MAG: hypothetical protein EOP18_04195, partial [Rhizobiaceae bacterium]